MKKISSCFDVRFGNSFFSILFLYLRLKSVLTTKNKMLLYVDRCDLFLTKVFSRNNSHGNAAKRKIQKENL